MAQKTTKKVAAKPATKKIQAKKVAHPVAPAKHECGCGHHCHCHHHHGCTFGHVLKKIIIFAIIFALGFATAKFVPCHRGQPRMPKPQFENGCLVVKSIKCPKLLHALPKLDVNHDGCVSPKEYRAAKRMFGPQKPGKHNFQGNPGFHGKPAQPAPQPAQPSAPVAE